MALSRLARFATSGWGNFSKPKHERVRRAGDVWVFAGLVEFLQHRGRRGDVRAAAATGADDLAGVDAKLDRIQPQPADGGACVGDGLQRRGAVLGVHTIIKGDARHAARGEVDAVRRELAHLPVVPAAAIEEGDGTLGIRRSLRGVRFPDVGGQVHAIDGLVDFFPRGLQQLAIAINRRELGQVFFEWDHREKQARINVRN
jgi:hypothetical protein